MAKRSLEFFRTFDARNLIDDKQLKTIVEQAKNILSNVTDAQQLRDSDSLRLKIAEGFEKVKETLSGLNAVTLEASRKLDFDIGDLD